MAIFEPQVIDNGNEEEIMLVRRSGRLKHRPQNRDTGNNETIDLTLDDSEEEQDNDIDGANGNVNGVQLEGENVDIDVILDKEKEQVASVENPVAKQGNVEGGNMDNDFVAGKETEQGGILKNIETRDKKEVKRGMGMKKMEHDREGNGKGKRVAGKRKMVPEAGKLEKRVVDGQDGDFIDKDATAEDGQSTDDDFVYQQKPKIPKVTVGKKKTFTTKRFEQKRVVGSGGKKGKNKAGSSVGRIVNRVHLRNPPGSLFRVITEMSDIQKKDVRSMGFGEVLAFKIKDIPTRLAYWLLDRFDENTCTLDVNGRSISITPDLVKNMLGVPRGDVHIQAPDNADYRNPLIRKWKEQFGEGVKKHFPSLVVKEILETKKGGWMFKLNFLVLFFSTIGELNLSNTVNLRFLPCIKNEDDILKLDWCTYIIECLVRTKRSWNRNAHFNGPVILLLVVYATSDIAIKHWSSEELHKLEGDMFSKESVDDAAADGRAGDEEINDEDLDEDIGWEDDVFEENGGESAQDNAEVMKRNASSYLKKARELLDMAEEVIDIGLEDNPDDYGFVELKELRDQLCIPRKYSHKPKDDEVFFPIIQGRHFFVLCMNMKDGEVQILDNLLMPNTTDDDRFNWFILNLISVFEDYLLHKNHPNYEKMTAAPKKVLQLGCRTTNNFVDCGVFTMRHMETYKGDGACADLCRLSMEGKKQRKELRELRIKYATKILLSELNLVKSDFDKEVHGFRNIPVEEKKRLQMAAFETIKLRVSNNCGVLYLKTWNSALCLAQFGYWFKWNFALAYNNLGIALEVGFQSKDMTCTSLG
ncbi:hypothetical protein CTI12_AA128140 [Artemisia annua]|uniref:Uncharacterized protein n=1 Tax=Artemisia annua TaxID=35608 RepID=A0A2U1PNR1_ARTAN|nr:hypothetical protein CTI12_AA128140 [Artemisia annua]